MGVCVCTWVYACVRGCMHVYVVCVCVCTWVYACVHGCMRVRSTECIFNSKEGNQRFGFLISANCVFLDLKEEAEVAMNLLLIISLAATILSSYASVSMKEETTFNTFLQSHAHHEHIFLCVHTSVSVISDSISPSRSLEGLGPGTDACVPPRLHLKNKEVRLPGICGLKSVIINKINNKEQRLQKQIKNITALFPRNRLSQFNKDLNGKCFLSRTRLNPCLGNWP